MVTVVQTFGEQPQPPTNFIRVQLYLREWFERLISEDDGLRRYAFRGFDVLIRTETVLRPAR